MIGSINGRVVLKKDKFVVVETAGVGYRVNVSAENLTGFEVDSNIFLWTYTHVREDQLDLYGFIEYKELEFFELLLGVSSIGPKSALAILSIAPMETLTQAISTSDLAYLTKISGIGKKTAEKIIIELRDKVEKNTEGSHTQDDLDVLEALKALGYSQNEARKALKEVNKDSDTNQKIKEALQILNRK
jgi:Holliday junction DNA helicase RuvA